MLHVAVHVTSNIIKPVQARQSQLHSITLEWDNTNQISRQYQLQ